VVTPKPPFGSSPQTLAAGSLNDGGVHHRPFAGGWSHVRCAFGIGCSTDCAVSTRESCDRSIRLTPNQQPVVSWPSTAVRREQPFRSDWQRGVSTIGPWPTTEVTQRERVNSSHANPVGFVGSVESPAAALRARGSKFAGFAPRLVAEPVTPFLSREAPVQAVAGGAKRVDRGDLPHIGAGNGSG